MDTINLTIALFSFIVAAISLYYSRLTLKKSTAFHLESLILQLIDIKASEANEAYRINNYGFDDKTTSHIVSILISFKESVDLMLEHKTISIDKKRFYTILLLQLHTDIRIGIKLGKFTKNDPSDILYQQVKEIQAIFKEIQAFHI